MSTHTTQDPRELGDKPPFPAQEQPYPGREVDMQPQPDCGEHSYAGSGKLKDKVALITGGDSGIGRAVAIAFAREGADILISYLSEEENEDAEETVRVVPNPAAARSRSPATSATRSSASISSSVQSPGSASWISWSTMPPTRARSRISRTSPIEEWDRAFKTNIYAMFSLSKFALRHLPEGGAIINTTSIQAYQPSGSLLHYATTKGAIVTFTKGLVRERR